MLLTLTLNHPDAPDLGYLLHKHPDRLQQHRLPYGTAHVFYPEVTPTRCTAALLMELDPVELVRTRKGLQEGFPLEQYVNDRPYVASSMLSGAISDVFGTALNGRSKERQALANTPLNWEVHVAVVASRGGAPMLQRLFEPLGYQMELTHHPLDTQFPEWGAGPYYSLTLRHTLRLSELLSHLYVLLPVLDNAKHYWVGTDELHKLLEKGEGWLAQHPDKKLITERYLRFKPSLTRAALQALCEEDDPESVDIEGTRHEAQLEAPLSLNQTRLQRIVEYLQQQGVHSVVDLGCGEGKLLKLLMAQRQPHTIIGMDISQRTLEAAHRKLRIEQMSPQQRQRLTLLHGSLLYRDPRLQGCEAAVAVEVIEHIEPYHVELMARQLFGELQPRLVLVSTPNREYNVLFGMSPQQMRHSDHRFEWTRQEFEAWGQQCAQRWGYSVTFEGIGPEDPELGAPTQLACFHQGGTHGNS
jgi:3' terminal RNA ribose 2'-O-methyltransferase Hen1